MFHVEHFQEKIMNTQNQTELGALSKELKLSGEQTEQFTVYIDLLEQWNQRTNLISKNDVPFIVSKHIKESLELLSLDVLNEEKSVMDMGTGAGLPGIPLFLLKTQLDMILVDSRKMKTLFLQDVIDKLKLEHVSVICQRIEDIKTEKYLKTVDVMLARAVTKLKDLWLWSEPFLKPDGMLVAYKGGNIETEVNDLLQKFKHLEVKIYPFQWSNTQDDKKFVIVSRQESQ